MIVSFLLLGDDLVGGVHEGIGGGGDSGVDSLDGLLDLLGGGLDGSVGLGLSLLGVVVTASGGADHHRDDGGGHKYLFHGCKFLLTS